MVAMSEEMKRYFEELERRAEEIYQIAQKARSKGYDPEEYVEIPRAEDLATRVEELTGVKGIAGRIRELTAKHGDRGMVSILIAKEIAGRYEDKKEALDKAVRVGLAVLTEGILVAPLEGIADIKLKNNPDGTKYVSMYYAGPIRGAGGTAQALSVLIADAVRRELGIGRYQPTPEEIERYKEEIQLYDRRKHLQYRPSDKEIETVVKNSPICIDGEGTETFEVSGYRDLERIEGNRVRSGMCLVLAEGVIQKAKKIKGYVEKLNIDGWDWIAQLIPEEKSSSKETKSSKYIEDIVAGRPVFAYPSRPGGFRHRYGRCRAGGLATISVSPATMHVLNRFIAIGTQLKTEKPGKAGGMTSCDSIEGPIVLLKNGALVQINTLEEAMQVYDPDNGIDEIEEIVDVGEILVPYGEFNENNYPLLPASYTVEWWVQEAQKAGFDGEITDARTAFEVSEKYGIPLHPDYNLFWHDLTPGRINELSEYVLEHAAWHDEKLLISRSESIKRTLVELGALHTETEDGYLLDRYAYPLIRGLGLDVRDDKLVRVRSSSADEPVKLVSELSGITIMPRAPSRIGTRMGRPEKAAERKMKKQTINLLFPVGSEVGNRRLLTDALDKKPISVEVGERRCPRCRTITHMLHCPKCGTRTEYTGKVMEVKVSVRELIEGAEERLGVHVDWDIKGVKKMMSTEHLPEPVEKGILRGKHEVYVFKDGTIRFDMSDITLTHFRPAEVGLSLEKAKELGYTHDYLGAPLVSEEQVLELKVQDILLPMRAREYLYRVAGYVDDLLEKYYGIPRFYNLDSPDDLIGHLVIGLAPHTSAGVLGRVVGFTEANVGFAHPFFHAAKRRNCDGDEDSVMLLLNALIDFSRKFLPSTRGGLMDAPLVLTTRIDPSEIDKEALNVDVGSQYPLEFYYATLRKAKPKEVEEYIDFVKKRVGTPKQYEGFAFTHDTRDINRGVLRSAYKVLGSMNDKIQSQLELAIKIRAVDEHDMATRIISHHFIPDIMGNLKKYGTQKFRCSKCNAKFRRMPLGGVCPKCGGKILLTVYPNSVKKYLDRAMQMATNFNVPDYVRQRVEILRDSIATIMADEPEEEEKDKITLDDFFS
uniref:DNA polymerase II large subunit n=1 Tax=uncultured euryarchaeote Alv-FOS1 TaxID=337892 RepID=Q3SAD4_9EURY|nr:DNA polymerase II large subunit [uncultured euryarchaeote Alv-FOS1]